MSFLNICIKILNFLWKHFLCARNSFFNIPRNQRFHQFVKKQKKKLNQNFSFRVQVFASFDVFFLLRYNLRWVVIWKSACHRCTRVENPMEGFLMFIPNSRQWLFQFCFSFIAFISFIFLHRHERALYYPSHPLVPQCCLSCLKSIYAVRTETKSKKPNLNRIDKEIQKCLLLLNRNVTEQIYDRHKKKAIRLLNTKEGNECLIIFS